MLKFYHTKGFIEAGCDEAGRGCLAGPVFAAAVILPANFSDKLSNLNDSKKLSEKQRDQLRPLIEKYALAWAVAKAEQDEIDEINILNASFLAMHRAIEQLQIKPESLLIDGNRFKCYPNIKHYCIIKGDSKFVSIAAASILAKTYRDDFMREIHQEYPCYEWNINKGYPTQRHRLCLIKHGISPYHRRSYRLLPTQLQMEF